MPNSFPQRPRVALIGVSGYGRIHLDLAQVCRKRGELDLIAAVVINPHEEQELVTTLRNEGCRIYDDYSTMLAKESGRLDLCLVPTGIHWHAPMTVAALRHGANVLVEKPLCSSTAEVKAICDAEGETGRFVAVGFQDLYEPGTRWLKAELVRGAIGRVKRVRFLGIWPRSRGYFTRNNWAGRLRLDDRAVYDSPLNNAFAHFVMLSLFFAGVTETDVSSGTLLDGELFRAHDIESFDTGVARLQTGNGVSLWFGASHACRRPTEPQIEIEGTEGTACWRYEKETWWRDRSGHEERRPLVSVSAARRHMMAAVLRRLRNADAEVCTPRMAGLHTSFVESLHRQVQILPFAVEQVSWGDGSDGALAVPDVAGLEVALRDAYETGSMLRIVGSDIGAYSKGA